MSKQELLGVVHRLPVTGNNQPTKDIVRKPFLSKESVVKTFCTGCGNDSEITLKIIRSFPEFDAISQTSDFSNSFVRTRRCILCDSKWHDVELVEISSLD